MGNQCCGVKKQMYTKFSVQIGSYYMDFELDKGVLNIKGFTLSSKTQDTLQFDADYEDMSLPQDTSKMFDSLQDFTKYLFDNRDKLEVSKNDLMFKYNPGKQFYRLPLKFQFDNKDVQIELEADDKSHPIKFLDNPSVYPYNAVVRVQAKNINQNDYKILTGSGVLIDSTTVLTVAHNVYQRQLFPKAHEVFIYVQTVRGEVKIQVKKHVFPKQYMTTNQTDMHKYDFAYLKLQKNDIIKDQQVLAIKYDVNDNNTNFELVGYSSKLDQKYKKVNGCYHLKCNKFIKLLQNYARYDSKAAPGISGGPLIVKQQGKFMVIGLHQCFIGNISQAILLTSKGKSPKQILDQLQKQKKLLSQAQLLQSQSVPNQPKKFQDHSNLNKQKDQKKDNTIKQGKDPNMIKKQGPKGVQTEDPNVNKKQNPQTKKDQIQKWAIQKFNQNKLEQSLKTFQRCLEVRKNDYGVNSIEYADTLHDIGNVHRYLKNKNEALKFYEQSLLIKQKTVGKNHVKYAMTLSNIGVIYSDKSDQDKALTYYESAQKIFELTQAGKKEKYYGTTLNRIGVVFSHKKLTEKAFQYFQQVKKLYQSTIGKENVDYANLMSSYGWTYVNLSDDKSALKYFSLSVQIMKKTKNEQHPFFPIYKSSLQNTKLRLNEKK